MLTLKAWRASSILKSIQPLELWRQKKSFLSDISQHVNTEYTSCVSIICTCNISWRCSVFRISLTSPLFSPLCVFIGFKCIEFVERLQLGGEEAGRRGSIQTPPSCCCGCWPFWAERRNLYVRWAGRGWTRRWWRCSGFDRGGLLSRDPLQNRHSVKQENTVMTSFTARTS